jgi:hypothetical protein
VKRGNDGNEDVVYCGKEDLVRYDEGLHTIENCEIKHPFL